MLDLILCPTNHDVGPVVVDRPRARRANNLTTGRVPFLFTAAAISVTVGVVRRLVSGVCGKQYTVIEIARWSGKGWSVGRTGKCRRDIRIADAKPV